MQHLSRHFYVVNKSTFLPNSITAVCCLGLANFRYSGVVVFDCDDHFFEKSCKGTKKKHLVTDNTKLQGNFERKSKTEWWKFSQIPDRKFCGLGKNRLTFPFW